MVLGRPDGGAAPLDGDVGELGVHVAVQLGDAPPLGDAATGSVARTLSPSSISSIGLLLPSASSTRVPAAKLLAGRREPVHASTSSSSSSSLSRVLLSMVPRSAFSTASKPLASIASLSALISAG